jgi:hypothetical protein
MRNAFTGRLVRSNLSNVIAIPVGIIILVIVPGPA